MQKPKETAEERRERLTDEQWAKTCPFLRAYRYVGGGYWRARAAGTDGRHELLHANRAVLAAIKMGGQSAEAEAPSDD